MGGYPFAYSHSKNQAVIFKDNFKLLKTGDPNGEHYMPAMSDAPLRGYKGRHEWFWEPGDEAHVFPLDALMKMYYGSVGRNSTLILGLTPDARGLLSEGDVARLKEFGAEIQHRFGHPLASTKGRGKRLQLKLPAKKKVNAVVLCEDLTMGERIRSYKIDGRVNGKWITLATGSCVGHKRIQEFAPIETTALRVRIGESIGVPVLKDFSVYAY